MILPVCLNYYTYHSSTQTAYHAKKVSGTSGTSQHACFTEKTDLYCVCTDFSSQHVPLNFMSFVKLPSAAPRTVK